MSEESGGGKDHLGLDESLVLGPPRLVVLFRAIACRRFRESGMGKNVGVVDEVNGSPPQTMGFSVIKQCEVEFTAREATTMTLWVFVSRPRRPYRVTAVS